MRIVLKYDEDQPRDEGGRWTSGGGGGSKETGFRDAPHSVVGGSKAGTQKYQAERTATLERKTFKEFKKMDTSELQPTIVRILKSPGGNTLAGIYAHVGQAYGLAPTKEVAARVDQEIKSLLDKGNLKINKDEIPVRHENKFGSSGKSAVKWVQDPNTGEWSREMREQFTFSLQSTKENPLPKVAEMPPLIHTLGAPRPDRFSPERGSLAEKALEFRRLDYPDTKVSPMGRFFSSSPNKDAPELMLGGNRQKLYEAGKISLAESKAKSGMVHLLDDTGKPSKVGTYIREEYFHTGKYKDNKIDFFDATSSVTAHVGAMTGDVNALVMSKLVASGDYKPPHHDVLRSFNIGERDTNKPYFSTFSGKNEITEKDLAGITKNRNADGIKEIAKAIWTRGSYGSPAAAMHKDLQPLLRDKFGMKKEDAKVLATKLIDNFQSSPMATFTKGLKEIVREAPHNFVYTNPMSGFKMSFNEYTTAVHRITLKDPETGKEIRPGAVLAKEVAYSRGEKKLGAAAPLFIQNWDAAVISRLMLDTKSTHTVHDAIGVPKDKQKDLNKSVVKAMNMVKNFNPMKDLADQIMRQHAKNGMPKAHIARLRKQMDAYVKRMTKNRAQVPDFVVIPEKPGENNNHFQPE